MDSTFPPRTFEALARSLTWGHALVLALSLVACTTEPTPVGQAVAPIVGGAAHPGDSNVVYLTYGNGASCTGTLIAPRVVLTANHCVDEGGLTGLSIGVGPSDAGGTICSSVCAIRATGSRAPDQDIAVLILAEDATVACGLAAFPWAGADPGAAIEDAITGIGYGLTNWNDFDSAGTKRSANNAIIGIQPGVYRTGPLGCYGDSGGPLVRGGTVVGVASQLVGQATSSGQADCAHSDTLYTRTDAHAALINQAIADATDFDCEGCDDTEVSCGGASGHVLTYCDSYGNIQELDCESLGDLTCSVEQRTCIGGPPIPSPECGANRNIGVLCLGEGAVLWCDENGIAGTLQCPEGMACSGHPTPSCQPVTPYEGGQSCNDDGSFTYCDANGHLQTKECPEGQSCLVDVCKAGPACCPPGPDERCGNLHDIGIACGGPNTVDYCDYAGHVVPIDCGDRACRRVDRDDGEIDYQCEPDPRCGDQRNVGLQCDEDQLTYCDELGVVRTMECDGRCIEGESPYCGPSQQCRGPNDEVIRSTHIECNLGNTLWYCDENGVFQSWSCGDATCQVGACQEGPACCPAAPDTECVNAAGETTPNVGLDCEVDYLRYCDEQGHVQGMTCPPEAPCVQEGDVAGCKMLPPLAQCVPGASPECIDENGYILQNVGLECEEDNLRYCDGSGVLQSVDCADGTVCEYDTCQPGPWCCPGAPPCANDTECDDGDACTADRCEASGCVHEPIVIDDGDGCTTDACDPATGTTHETVATDDYNACTDDYCDSSTGEVHHDDIDVDDGDACTYDSCEPWSGQIRHDAQSVDDGSACTSDTCDPATGTISHDAVEIDDGDACTWDYCEPWTGWVGHYATWVDDWNACTVDACDPTTGNITHEQVEIDDGDACTMDSCEPWSGWVRHDAMYIDDGSACTVDSCDPATGSVSHESVDIDDGDACTMDYCEPWSGWVSHYATWVDDWNACTVDACDPTTGNITHEQVEIDDGDACTMDSCEPWSGWVRHDAMYIDDGNACTTDACDPATGSVSHDALDIDDGDACTMDYCEPWSGWVSHNGVNVDDWNACTEDTCDPSSGEVSHIETCDDPDGGGPSDGGYVREAGSYAY